MNKKGAPWSGFLPPLAAIAAALCAGGLAAFLMAQPHRSPPRLLLPSAAREVAGGTIPVRDSIGLELLAQPRALPNVSFRDASGRLTDLAAFRGRVVLLNLWAPWCVPCRSEMPSLNRLEARLGGSDFVVLPVSVGHDGIAAVEQFYRDDNLQYLSAYADPSDRIGEELAIPGIPTSFLLDRHGRELALEIGPAAWDSPKMVALIRRYLPAPSITREASR